MGSTKMTNKFSAQDHPYCVLRWDSGTLVSNPLFHQVFFAVPLRCPTEKCPTAQVGQFSPTEPCQAYGQVGHFLVGQRSGTVCLPVKSIEINTLVASVPLSDLSHHKIGCLLFSKHGPRKRALSLGPVFHLGSAQKTRQCSSETEKAGGRP